MFSATGLGNSQQGGAGGNPTLSGYLVDKKGMITLPYIGDFMAAGLTAREMELFIGKQLERFVKEPVVKIRFMNHAITVLGDIGSGGRIAMNQERMTLLDALAMSGDLRTTAYRKNILVIREDNGYRTTGRVDLTSKTLFENPYFYMQNRDMVYVEPVQAAYVNRTDRISKYFGIGGTILSLTLSLWVLIR